MFIKKEGVINLFEASNDIIRTFGMNIIGSSRGQRVLAAHIAMLIAMRL